jgi:hypothetical protein
MASSISLTSFAAKSSNILNPDGTTIDQSFAPVNGSMFRNRIINGDMRIDQRNAGASVTPSSAGSSYALDRMRVSVGQGSKISIQQSSVAPAGFSSSVLITSLSAYTVLSGDTFQVGQVIEGFNVADFDLGLSTAKTFTVSFWVRCSLTGLIGGAAVNAAGTRSYPFSFSVSSANTWEYKTVTIAGDTTGTWDRTNGAGLRIRINLGSGSAQSATSGVWTAGDFGGPTGAISFVGTNAATMYVTGLQVEPGSSATPFEVRPYGTELSLCYRYFYRTTSPVQSAGASASAANWVMTFVEFFPVPMRTDTPSEVGTPALTCELAGPSGSFIATGIAVGIAAWGRFSIRYEVTSGTAAAYFRSLSRDRQISAEL